MGICVLVCFFCIKAVKIRDDVTGHVYVLIRLVLPGVTVKKICQPGFLIRMFSVSIFLKG